VPQYTDGIVVCPFDAELFGHWWFEGAGWIEAVLEAVDGHPTVSTTTPRRELATQPPVARLRLQEGSWGEGGDHRVWLNPETEWMWHDLAVAQGELAALLERDPGEPRTVAAINQLLLLAASDWPFLITMKTGEDYAEARFREHRRRLSELVAGAVDGEAPLPGWASLDRPFPQATRKSWSNHRD